MLIKNSTLKSVHSDGHSILGYSLFLLSHSNNLDLFIYIQNCTSHIQKKKQASQIVKNDRTQFLLRNEKLSTLTSIHCNQCQCVFGLQFTVECA